MKPVLLNPAFKDYLWGGTRLKTDFNKKSDLDIVAESWELSTHPAGESAVADGEYAGLTLSAYIEKIGRKYLGKNALAFDYFPLLIKFIDAKKDLSIQVHPNDEYAKEHEGEYGKTEMWYILDCEEGAYLYYGFNRVITKEEYRQRIADNTLIEVLNRVPVKKGDVFFIEAGTVHAICSGIVICEIQQNSNTTYRVYDYDRRDANGNTRPLHIEQAIAVSSLCPPPAHTEKNTAGDCTLSSCKYFTVKKYVVNGEKNLSVTPDCFQSLIVADGCGTLKFDGETIPFKKGDSIFIPAQSVDYQLTGCCEVILSYV